MTMTNPDKPITKQDLNDYHNAILPYLGGMPEIYANKFAKGDLYDTNEKIIGCWTNGKPLYQKTIDIGVLPSRTTKDVSLGISNLDTIYNISGVAINSSIQESVPIPFVNDTDVHNQIGMWIIGNTLTIISRNTDSSPFDKCYVTIQYTKTTDQANSFNFGNTTDYSTDEKIVGTWLDGSYIYQKTIDFGLLPNNSSKSVAHGISNLKRVINYSAIMQNTSSIDGRPIPIYAEGSNNFVSVEYNDSVIKVYASNDRRNFYSYVTLQYTKTI